MKVMDLFGIIDAAVEACIRTLAIEKEKSWKYKGPKVYLWDDRFHVSQDDYEHVYETVEDVITALPEWVIRGIKKEEAKRNAP